MLALTVGMIKIAEDYQVNLLNVNKTINARLEITIVLITQLKMLVEYV
jgi:hypothetical protein